MNFARVAAAVGLLALFAVGACRTAGSTGLPASLAGLQRVEDAPIELAEAQDLKLARAQYAALSTNDASRGARRIELADEYARRIDAAFARGHDPEGAFENLLALTSLWSADELTTDAIAQQMARYETSVQKVRAFFSRGGGDREATAALAILSLIHPDKKRRYVAEIEEIYAYADALAVAKYGAGAQRARPIDILESVAPALPIPLLVDKLSELYRSRQKAIESQFRRGGADLSLIRAHGRGVMLTVHNIVRLYAIAGRLGEAPAAIRDIVGIGDDPDLRSKLRRALAPSATPTAWIMLARAFRHVRESSQSTGQGGTEDTRRTNSPGKEDDDPATSLRILRAGIKRMPSSAGLQCIAGTTADALDNIWIAIPYFESCLRLAPGEKAAADALAGMYEARIGTLMFSDRPRRALTYLADVEAFHADARKQWPDASLGHDLASVFSTVGRALVSLGELDGAEYYLTRSVAARPDFPALVSVGTIALKRGKFDDALRFLRLAERLPAGNLQERFQRAKVLRLMSAAYTGKHDTKNAARVAESALRAWTDVSSNGRLVDKYQGELHTEVGKLLWQLGRKQAALEQFDAAVDADPGGATTHAGVVAVLVVRDRPRPALDAYHRALGSFEIDDYFKVYMSLWIVAEARRRGVAPDRLALDYLSRRKGRLWRDQLAAFASGNAGKAEVARLAARATTRSRRAELMYYTAMLGPDASNPVRTRKLLQKVVESDMVLFFEYDMAKQWLRQQTTQTTRTTQTVKASPTTR